MAISKYVVIIKFFTSLSVIVWFTDIFLILPNLRSCSLIGPLGRVAGISFNKTTVTVFDLFIKEFAACCCSAITKSSEGLNFLLRPDHDPLAQERNSFAIARALASEGFFNLLQRFVLTMTSNEAK